MAAGLEGVLIPPLAWTLPLQAARLQGAEAGEWVQQAGKGALGKMEQVECKLGGAASPDSPPMLP